MSNKRILIVDDEKGFTSILKINLEATGGYEVCVQNNSELVVDTALEFRPDIVLLDIVMPGLDGGDVKRQFQNVPGLKDIPIVFVTAMVSGEDASSDDFVHSGDDILLPKPITTDVIIRCIEDRLAGRI